MHYMMSVNYLHNVYALTSLWYTETINTIRHVFEQCSAILQCILYLA